MSAPERIGAVAARYLTRLRTRQETTMTATAPHVLVITGSAEDCTRRYDIECPGVTDACRMYVECGCPESSDFDIADCEPEAHGVEHRYIEGDWMKPTDQCFVSTFDQLPDAADDLAARERLINGRYPIDFDYQGEGWYQLQLLAPVSA